MTRWVVSMWDSRRKGCCSEGLPKQVTDWGQSSHRPAQGAPTGAVCRAQSPVANSGSPWGGSSPSLGFGGACHYGCRTCFPQCEFTIFNTLNVLEVTSVGWQGTVVSPRGSADGWLLCSRKNHSPACTAARRLSPDATQPPRGPCSAPGLPEHLPVRAGLGACPSAHPVSICLGWVHTFFKAVVLKLSGS